MNHFSVNVIPISHITGQSATILHLHEAVNAKTYNELIKTVQSLFMGGSTQLVLDLTDVPRLNLMTLFSLYAIATIADNQQPTNPEYGWNALHEMANRLMDHPVDNLHLCAAQPKVMQDLQQANFTDSVAMFDTLSQAVAAFAKTAVTKSTPVTLTKQNTRVWQTAVA